MRQKVARSRLIVVMCVLLAALFVTNYEVTRRQQADATAEKTRRHAEEIAALEAKSASYEALRNSVQHSDTKSVRDWLLNHPQDAQTVFWFGVREGQAAVLETVCSMGFRPAEVRTERIDVNGIKLSSNCLQESLAVACGKGYEDVVRFTVKHGADYQARDEIGRTPLATAAYFGNVDVVKYLISLGASVNDRVLVPKVPAPRAASLNVPRSDVPQLMHMDGMTPLMLASERQHVEVVRVLLAHGADVSCKSREGYSALQLCEQSIEHPENLNIPASEIPKRQAAILDRVNRNRNGDEVKRLLSSL